MNPFDPFERIEDDPQLVALDRMSRALHAINFFGAQRHGLLFLRVHERLLKSVKYDHGQHFSTVLVSFGLESVAHRHRVARVPRSRTGPSSAI